MSEIKPLDLPSAAGVDFGRGDVRHFSEDDAVDVPGLQNPTRQLAQRDNLMATKLNEVIGVVNNKEQFVPLVLPKTTVPPGMEEIVTNFKIPDGFEARVLNAAIGSNPASSALLLKVYYAAGYGNLTGTELLSTQNSFNAGLAFYNDGEFIVSVRNNGSMTIDASASLTLTIRPIGSQSSLLVGSIIRGPRGYPGGKGDIGGRGDPGVGGAGSAGMVWAGYFYGTNTYGPPQVVSYNVGGVVSSYISTTLNNAPSVAPPDPTYWDLVAQGGNTGASGDGVIWEGPWSSATAYSVNDAVSYTVTGVTTSYICKVAVGPSLTTPPDDAAHWDVLVAPGGETPNYTSTLLIGTGGTAPAAPYVALGASYTGGSSDGDYPGGGTPATNVSASMREIKIYNTTGTLAVLTSQRRSIFTGTVTAYLPQIANGATFNWTTSNTQCVTTVDLEGTVPGTIAQTTNLASVTAVGGNAFRVVVDTPEPRKVTVTMFGIDSAL